MLFRAHSISVTQSGILQSNRSGCNSSGKSLQLLRLLVQTRGVGNPSAASTYRRMRRRIVAWNESDAALLGARTETIATLLGGRNIKWGGDGSKGRYGIDRGDRRSAEFRWPGTWPAQDAHRVLAERRAPKAAITGFPRVADGAWNGTRRQSCTSARLAEGRLAASRLQHACRRRLDNL